MIGKRFGEAGQTEVQDTPAALAWGQQQAAAVQLRNAMNQRKAESKRRALPRECEVVFKGNAALPSGQQRLEGFGMQSRAAVCNRNGEKCVVVMQGDGDIARHRGDAQGVGKQVVQRGADKLRFDQRVALVRHGDCDVLRAPGRAVL